MVISQLGCASHGKSVTDPKPDVHSEHYISNTSEYTVVQWYIAYHPQADDHPQGRGYR